jgi:hypothetical protein
MRRFLIGSASVNNYKSVIDMHIILVRVVRSIQNSCIKYATQNILLKCSLTLTILIIIRISIILLFQFNLIEISFILQLFHIKMITSLSKIHLGHSIKRIFCKFTTLFEFRQPRLKSSLCSDFSSEPGPPCLNLPNWYYPVPV